MVDADGARIQLGLRGTWAVLWEVPTGDWSEWACRQAGRNLSRAEWTEYVGESVEYRKICPGYPVPDEGLIVR